MLYAARVENNLKCARENAALQVTTPSSSQAMIICLWDLWKCPYLDQSPDESSCGRFRNQKNHLSPNQKIYLISETLFLKSRNLSLITLTKRIVGPVSRLSVLSDSVTRIPPPTAPAARQVTLVPWTAELRQLVCSRRCRRRARAAPLNCYDCCWTAACKQVRCSYDAI